MSGHSFLFTGDPYGGAITIAATTRGDINLGSGNTYNMVWLMPTTDVTISVVRSDSTSQAPTSASATAAAGAFVAIPAYGRFALETKTSQYVGLYNFGAASITVYYTAGTAPS